MDVSRQAHEQTPMLALSERDPHHSDNIIATF
jgi:hypothetical protein